MPAQIYDALSTLLRYPYEPLQPALQKAMALLEEKDPKHAQTLRPFVDQVMELRPEKVEELYVKTFDVQANCCLDIGYVLFGEDYKRGQFMAEIRGMETEYSIDCGSDLPDFLPNLLKLICQIPEDDAGALVRAFIYPAIMKMIETFDDEGSNFYRLPIIVLRDLLKETYQLVDAEIIRQLPVVQEEKLCPQI